jgi:UDP-3-O-[3-hydroxymyristoyl] glucosamine N-acyltransferase
MRLQNPITVAELAQMLGATLIGNPENVATGINEIHKVVAGDVTFVDVEKYYYRSVNSAATIIIINQPTECPEGKTLLVCEYPFDEYNKLVKRFSPKPPVMMQPISEDAQIGANTRIDPNVVIYPNVKIGANCHIRANVTIYENTIIGDYVTIHAGTVIGSDAFYYKNKGNYWDKWHSCGSVIIEDNVEIGAACTIDKGVSGDTIIGRGTKLDNQVHVAHGVVIGAKCLIAAQVGIAGKTRIGNGVFIWGQAGISKDLTIGDGAQIMAQSGVSKDLVGGKTYFGTPVAESKDWFNEFRFIKALPKRIQRLEDRDKEDKE